MSVRVFDLNGKHIRDAELPASVFGVEPHSGVMHQALLRQLANARRGTAKAQTRGEVSRTGKKWFRQKGTGRARHGARSAPIFVGGGVAHGPRPRKYTQAMPRRMRHLALRSALSVRAGEDAVALVDGLRMEVPKTAAMRQLVDGIFEGASTLLLLAGPNEPVARSVRNLPHVRYLNAAYLNVRDLLGYDRLLIETEAVERIVALFSGAAVEADDASV
jgi:large subunit ribosomal protein L4